MRTVLDVLARRTWTEQARCAEPPFDEMTWVTEPSGGIEYALTAVTLIEICQSCPVRRECLEDALTETRFTVEGCWGGTMRTERQRAIHAAITAARATEQPVVDVDPISGREMTTKIESHGGWRESPALIKQVADELDATLDERLQWWRDRMARGRGAKNSRALATELQPWRAPTKNGSGLFTFSSICAGHGPIHHARTPRFG